MFDKHETRPHHFFIPTILAIIGGIFAHIRTWEYVGWIVWAVAGACTYFLIYSAVKKYELDRLEKENDHYAEIMKLDDAKTKTKVVIDKTPLTGFMHQNVSEIEIAPAKLKKFAHGVLILGQKLTIREWTPLKNGKLFSRNEWERLIAFMKKPDWEDAHVKFIVPINPNNEKDGYELTAAGRKWLEDVLENSVLMPSSP